MKKIFIIIIILFSKISFAIDVDDAIKSTIENNPKVKITANIEFLIAMKYDKIIKVLLYSVSKKELNKINKINTIVRQNKLPIK